MPSRSQVTRLTWPERICGWRMIRASARGTGSRAEDGVGELLVLVAELDALRLPVQPRAGEPDREVAPVVRRQRAREVVRAGRDRVAACADHRLAGGEDPAVARRRPRLDQRERVRALPPEVCRRRRRDRAARRGRTTRRRDRPDPAPAPRRPRPSSRPGSSSRPAASISGSTSTSVSSVRDGQTSSAAQVATPGPAPTSSSDRGPPIGPLHGDLPEDGRGGGERRRRAVREIRRHLRLRSRRPRLPSPR